MNDSHDSGISSALDGISLIDNGSEVLRVYPDGTTEVFLDVSDISSECGIMLYKALSYKEGEEIRKLKDEISKMREDHLKELKEINQTVERIKGTLEKLVDYIVHDGS